MKKTLVFLLLSVFTFFAPRVNTVAAASNVVLQPNFQEVGVKNNFKVDVILRTDQKLVGVDVILKFDKNILDVVTVTKGLAFDLMPQKSSGNGTLKITGLTEGSFTGKGTLATVTFVGKKVGESKLQLSYKAKSTVDSNFTTAEVKDVLSGTVVGTFQVGSGFERFLEFLTSIFFRFGIPLIIFLIFVGIAIFLYRRWKKEQEGQVGYTPPDIPMDRPPGY